MVPLSILSRVGRADRIEKHYRNENCTNKKTRKDPDSTNVPKPKYYLIGNIAACTKTVVGLTLLYDTCSLTAASNGRPNVSLLSWTCEVFLANCGPEILLSGTYVSFQHRIAQTKPVEKNIQVQASCSCQRLFWLVPCLAEYES